MIATILSHRTRDENTSKAFQQLFSTYKDVKEIAESDERKIQELIKPAGFHRVKARRIKEVSKIIINQYNGKVPSDPEKLLSLPSVGRKTANCVLVYGFGKEAIPVDTQLNASGCRFVPLPLIFHRINEITFIHSLVILCFNKLK
ncbi:MAG: endonuclease III domain-containing protein [Nitrososphaerales archaeon]